MGKTVKFLGFYPDVDNNDSYRVERKLAVEQAKQRHRIKRLARQAAREKAAADDDWRSIANHYLWGNKPCIKRRSK